MNTHPPIFACCSISRRSARHISRASSGSSRWSGARTRSAKRRAGAIASTRHAATPLPITTSRQTMAEARDSKVPVLTEVVAEGRRARPAMDAQALEALARELERAVLSRLAPEVDRVIDEKLAQVLGQALEGVRAELTVSVTQMVREAIAASVSRALAQTDSK